MPRAKAWRTRRATPRPGRRRSLTDRGGSLRITSYRQLLEHEREILARIAKLPNGAQLFLAHPFRCLADVGVALAETVEREIRALHPELSGLSPTPYEFLKRQDQDPLVQIELRGLFRRREP
jgi:hypothetical protein